MPNPNSLTIWIAIYGAILSTLAIGWNIYTYLKSQPSLMVEGKLVSYVVVTISYPAIEVRVTNPNQRVISVSQIGFKAKSTPDLLTLAKDQIYNGNDLPKELHESQLFSFFVHSEYVVQPSDIEYLFARDSTGKTYLSKKMPLLGQRYPAN